MTARFARPVVKVVSFGMLVAFAPRSGAAQTRIETQVVALMQREAAAEIGLMLGPGAPHARSVSKAADSLSIEVHLEDTPIPRLRVWVGWPSVAGWHAYRIAEYRGRLYRAGGFDQHDLVALSAVLPPTHGTQELKNRVRELAILRSEGHSLNRPMDSVQISAADCATRHFLEAEIPLDTAYQWGLNYRAYAALLVGGEGYSEVNENHLILTATGRVVAWRSRTISTSGRSNGGSRMEKRRE